MKALILIFLSILLVSANLSAQDRIDKLSDKIDKLTEQVAETNKQILETNKLVAELAKQQAITATKLDGFEKSVEKRFDILFYVIIGGISALFVAIFGLVALILWDRRATLKPFETKTNDLQKEVNLLKEKELKHLEKEMKMELYIRQISQIDNRFAPFNP